MLNLCCSVLLTCNVVEPTATKKNICISAIQNGTSTSLPPEPPCLGQLMKSRIGQGELGSNMLTEYD